MKRDLDYVWHLHFVIAGRINGRWVFFKTVARRKLPYIDQGIYDDPKYVSLGSYR